MIHSQQKKNGFPKLSTHTTFYYANYVGGDQPIYIHRLLSKQDFALRTCMYIPRHSMGAVEIQLQLGSLFITNLVMQNLMELCTSMNILLRQGLRLFAMRRFKGN